jgi:S-adenosylmethionine decarboxylase proenzyme
VSALGYHLLIEFYGCDHDILNNVGKIKNLMDTAAITSGATIVESVFHRFNPHGVSGVVVIAESHLAIHTWPEYDYAAVDLFTCGDSVDPWKAYEFLNQGLSPRSSSTKEIVRGQIPGIEDTVEYGPAVTKTEHALSGHL